MINKMGVLRLLRRLAMTGALLVVVVALFAARYTPESYIEAFGPLARRIECEYGIPATIVLAQAMLESGYGNSQAARLRNNHFGIDHGRRRYGSVEECYTSYALLLTGSARYASLFEIPLWDYNGWAHGLQRCGYAMDGRYAGKLVLLVERWIVHELH